jgi:hypothetical protein
MLAADGKQMKRMGFAVFCRDYLRSPFPSPLPLYQRLTAPGTSSSMRRRVACLLINRVIALIPPTSDRNQFLREEFQVQLLKLVEPAELVAMLANLTRRPEGTDRHSNNAVNAG